MSEIRKEMEVPFVDLLRQIAPLRQELQAAIDGVIQSSGFILGEALLKFEAEWAGFVGTPECVGVGSGGDALYLTLKAMGVGTGDEVIVPANTFVATLDAVCRCGGRPVLVDCDPQSYLMDIPATERVVTGRTKVIVPVHLYGQVVDPEAVIGVAERHHLQVLEDAAQAHGAKCRGKPAGSFGDAAAWSFYPSKNLGAFGDAGAVTTGNPEIARKVRQMRNYGSLDKYQHAVIGLNSRMDTLQAAILSVLLRKLPDWNARRQLHASLYSRALAGLPVKAPIVSPESEHIFHLFVVRSESRGDLQAFLTRAGVHTGIHYPIPTYDLESYRWLGYTALDFPVTARLARTILSLPMFAGLRDEERTYVVDCVRSWVEMQGA